MKYVKLRFDFDDLITRTVVVPADWSLAFLHLVIQDTIGWLDCHMYEFKLEPQGRTVWVENPEADAEEDPDLEFKPANQTPISAVLSKKGAQLHYVYDFGDYNEVTIELLGSSRKPSPDQFKSMGPYAIEDCAGLGGMAAILAILERPKSEAYAKLEEWLLFAFQKRIEDIAIFPTKSDIYGRVFKLVRAIGTANPTAPDDCWRDYLVQR